MYQFDIKIAGMTFHITSQYKGCPAICREYLIQDQGEHNIVLTAEDITYERACCAKEKGIDENLKNAHADYIETFSLLRKLAEYITAYNRVLMHGSAIAIDGKGYIFTALSGTGKSTHTALLRKKFGERAVMVNDDKPFLHIDGNQVYVCGTPWRGKHSIGENIIVPLKGIFFLRRSEENVLEKMAPENAVTLLAAQCYRPSDPVQMMDTLSLMDSILTNVPLYDFGCNMDMSAAELSSSVMK